MHFHFFKACYCSYILTKTCHRPQDIVAAFDKQEYFISFNQQHISVYCAQ